MNVRLISVTKPVGEDVKHLTAEELTAFVARVSNPSTQLNNDTASKLLGYCLKNSHYSVFEHITFTVEIVTSRAIAAQILRHRSACFQEFSQRYAEVLHNEFYPARRQDTKNRRNSIDDMSEEDREWFNTIQNDNWNKAVGNYKEALQRGIAKELARMLLPLSTQTKLYMTNNLRNWLHYCDLRCEKSTQLEHREIADQIKTIICEQFPNIALVKGWTTEGENNVE